MNGGNGMNGGYIYLPNYMSNYFYERILSGQLAPEKKDGYFNILTNIVKSKKPIISEYKGTTTFIVGYISSAYTENEIFLSFTSQIVQSGEFITISAAIIVTPDDNVTVLRKIIGG